MSDRERPSRASAQRGSARCQATLDGSTSAYYLHCDLYFDSADAMMAAVTSPEGAAAAADVAKFATGE